MAAKFYALLTARGEAKLAQAAALGTQLKITQMAVGDGNGTLPTPNASQTKLVKENRRAAINTLSVDPLNTSQIIAEQVIPENEGGWWIREIGLFDAAGDLIAVANCAETYKPLLAEGSGRTQVIRMILIVSSTDAVTLKIDPSVVLATRKYVDDAVIEVKAYADDLMAKHLAAADPHTQYAPKKDPTLTGTPKAPTAANGNNTTQIATTQFVQAAIGLLKGDAPLTLDTLAELAAAINNDPNFYSTMASQLALKATIASPTFTGTPKAPTATAGNNSTQLATTQFVQTAIAQLVASAPGALDTLNELAAALGDDPNFATTITNQLALKAPLASPALTGTPTAPTPATTKNDTQIATTAFVQSAISPKAPLENPTFTKNIMVNGAAVVSGGGSYGATLTLGYRQLFQRDGATGYQTFTRSDVTVAPASDTEIGRILFGYGMNGSDSWGTGGVLAYINTIAQAGGGGKLGLAANNDAGKTTAAVVLDGKAGTLDFTGEATFSGVVNFNGLINANRHDGCISFSSSDATKPILSVNYSGAGNFGIWDTTNSTWVLRKDTSNNWYMYAGLTVAGAAVLGENSTVVTPSKGDNSTKIASTAFVQNELAESVTTYLVPVGVIMTWPTATPPAGWIKCNGAAFSATAYPELAKVYTNLKVPDLRGEFIRGFDDGRGVDSGRVIATGQGATSIRTAAVDYPGIDTTTEGATVGTPYSKADSVSKGQPTDARSPDNGVLGSILSDNAIQGTQFQSGIPGGAVWITMRPRNVAFNFIVRAA